MISRVSYRKERIIILVHALSDFPLNNFLLKIYLRKQHISFRIDFVKYLSKNTLFSSLNHNVVTI